MAPKHEYYDTLKVPRGASAEEIRANPRARSATLRVAERTAAPYDPQSKYFRIEPDARWRN